MNNYIREIDSRHVLPVVLGVLPANIVKSDSVVPITTEKGDLAMAVLESCDDEILYKVDFIANRKFQVAVVSEAALQYAIERYCAG